MDNPILKYMQKPSKKASPEMTDDKIPDEFKSATLQPSATLAPCSFIRL